MIKEKYPLDVMNVSTDYYAFMSKGHHNVHDFMQHVRTEFGEHYIKYLGYPQHIWMKTVPDSTGEYSTRFTPVEQGTRGAYPVTFTCEFSHINLYVEECKARREEPFITKPLVP